MGFFDTYGEYLEFYAKLVWSEISGNTTRATELKNELHKYKYDTGWWSEVIKEYLKFKEQGKMIPYRRHRDVSDYVIPIENKLKIALIADWGTGEEDAVYLLKKVMNIDHPPDILIHLGDIYYSGTKDEVQKNFLGIIRENIDLKKTKVFTLAGNHDMYSGGEGYYWLLDQLNQPASYFCLRNDYWQFLAMDTSLNDSNPLTADSNLTYLDPVEADWHLDKFNSADKRKTILLSHHQPFSHHGVGIERGRKVVFNPHLYTAFRNILDRVELWLWGHEHNLLIFEQYMNIKRGRCIGAGAFPVMAQDNPYEKNKTLYLQGQSEVPKRYKEQLKTNRDGFYYHAFAIMELNDAQATVKYYQVDSIENGQMEPFYEESLGDMTT